MNECMMMGRLTKDPEITTVGDKNTPKATFAIAIDRPGKKDEADFPRCVAWGTLAENIAKFVGKGCRIAIVGHIQTGSYKDKNGSTVYTTDVIVDKANFVDFKDGKAPAAAPSEKAGKQDDGDPDMW